MEDFLKTCSIEQLAAILSYQALIRDGFKAPNIASLRARIEAERKRLEDEAWEEVRLQRMSDEDARLNKYVGPVSEDEYDGTFGQHEW